MTNGPHCHVTVTVTITCFEKMHAEILYIVNVLEEWKIVVLQHEHKIHVKLVKLD